MLTLASLYANAQTTVAEEVLRVKPSSATVQVWFNRIEKEKQIVLSYNPALIRMDNVVAIRRGGTMTIARLLSQLLRSEEHTSELQSRQYLVCRLLLEKKHLSQLI